MLTRTAGLAGALITTSLVLVALPGQAVAPGVNGRLLVVADYDAHTDIFLMNPDGSGRVNLTGEDMAYVVYSPQASPDGSRIVFSRSVSDASTDQIYVMDADGTDKQPLTTGEQGGGAHPTWSPDGTSIAFVRAQDIWTMDADGGNQVRVADAGWNLSSPEWSPNGLSIAYVHSDQAAGSRIVTQPAGGGVATFRTDYNKRVGRPSWSPDGTKLLFWYTTGGVPGLYTMSPTGGAVTLVRAISSSHLGAYAWSPQGDRIVFASSEASSDREIWVMDADGTDATQVTSTADGFEHGWASWSAEISPATPLPTQTEGQPMTAYQLPFGGEGTATYSVLAGFLPPGIALSPSGQLSGTPTEWGTYIFTVTASDGETAEKVKYSLTVLDPEPPEVAVIDPAASTADSHSVTASLLHTVRWGGADETSGMDTYDLRYRQALWNGGFGGFVEPGSWTGLDEQALNHPLPFGSTTCYSARGTDRSGVTGPWSPERCTIAPVDETSLTTSKGWKTKSSTGFMGGTALSTKRKKATLRLPGAQLTRVGVLATTCPTCGKVDVYVGGEKIGRISLARGSSKLNRMPLMLPAFSQRSGTVRVKVVTKERTVRIDGLLVGAR
jgi:hypothetical protein